MANNRILRFHAPDKVFHSVNAITWFALLFTGVYVYFCEPEAACAEATMLAHLILGVVFTFNLLGFIVLAPDRFALILRACLEWDRNTIFWFRNFGGYPRRFFKIPFGPVEVPPQGRYNGGQKASYLLFMGMIAALTVTGWMLYYCWYMASGALSGLDAAGVGKFFGATLGDPVAQVVGMTLVVLMGCGVCAMGVQKGVERVVKLMMLGLLFILMALVIRSLTLPGAEAGVSFYLSPDPSKLEKTGLFPVINAAMNQAFFTLSVGIGAMCIFGSYQGKDRSLTGEAMWIMGLDTFVALMAGLIIFPACFAFGVEPGSGPGLVFVTLPNIFNVMAGGQLWGTLFFIFMSFAALSTVIAVFENIISYSADVWGMERRRATWLHAVGIWVCSLPCALGFNLLADFQPLGAGTCVLDLEDFLISNNILPLGGLFFLLFCCLRRGWGWDNFIAEADTGRGMKFPKFLRFYLTWVLPVVFLFIFAQGYIQKFF